MVNIFNGSHLESYVLACTPLAAVRVQFCIQVYWFFSQNSPIHSLQYNLALNRLAFKQIAHRSL